MHTSVDTVPPIMTSICLSLRVSPCSLMAPMSSRPSSRAGGHTLGIDRYSPPPQPTVRPESAIYLYPPIHSTRNTSRISSLSIPSVCLRVFLRVFLRVCVCRSGYKVAPGCSMSSPQEVAQVMAANRDFRVGSGILLNVPIPEACRDGHIRNIMPR